MDLRLTHPMLDHHESEVPRQVDEAGLGLTEPTRAVSWADSAFRRITINVWFQIHRVLGAEAGHAESNFLSTPSR